MTTRTARDSSVLLKGLGRAVFEAVHPTMHRLGQIALAQGFSQESLAEKLRMHFGLKANGKNVYDHFVAPHPHRKTIERYAQILGVTAERLYALEHGTLDAEGLRHWEQEVLSTLATFKSRFNPSAIPAVKKALRDSSLRQKVLTATVTATPFGIPPGWPILPSPIDVFAPALLRYGGVDLRDFIYLETPGGNPLWMIYSEALLNLYGGNQAKARAFVDACAAILTLDGFDTRPMYERLNRQLNETPALVKRHRGRSR